MIKRLSATIAVGFALIIAMQPIAAQQPAMVRVPTSVLERYVGEWVYPDGERVTVRLVGDTLFREVPGQRVPFVPLSETLFRLGPVFTAEMRRTDLRVVVRLKGDTLIREIGDQQVLTPLSETRFRVAGTSLIVEFVVDDAGVTQILGSGGQQMLARLKPKR